MMAMTKEEAKASVQILHLEDNAEDQAIIRELLKAEDMTWSIRGISTREDFIAALRGGGIDLILVDFNFPSFDGLTALAMTKELTPETPVVMVSGVFGEDAAVESLRNGATDYVLKRSLAKLGVAIRRAINETKERNRRRAAEQVLAEGSARYRRLVEASPDAIFVQTNERFSYINAAGTALFGAGSDKDLLGHPILDRVQAGGHEALKEGIARALRGEQVPPSQQQLLRMDNSVVSIELTTVLFPFQGGNDLQFIARDVTERKRLEERLWDAVDLNEKILAATRYGIAAFRADGPCIMANKAAEWHTGAKDGQQEAYDFRKVATWSTSGLLAAAEEVLATGRSRDIDIQFPATNGVGIWLDCSLTRFEVRGMSCLLLISIDVSELKQALESVVAANRSLETSNEDLEQFAYVASHDLKAPLRAIDNLATWIAEDLGELLQGEPEANMALLRSRIKRLEALLDGLLQYNRIGRKDVDRETISAGQLLTEIKAMIAPPPGFELVWDEHLPTLTVAKAPLGQVLVNLIANAIKHHDRENGRIEIRVTEHGQGYQFAVSDDGPGIPPEMQERVFGMFQTLKSKDEVEGSGLGLAVVKRHVEREGGVVGVDSDGIRGTTFWFSWPKAGNEQEAG